MAGRIATTDVRHESVATVRGTRKIEGLTKSAEGDLVFATSDFDWPPNEGSAEPDLYNGLLYWPLGQADQAAIANPTSNGGTISSVSLHQHFVAALKSDKYPLGPQYFKVEGLVAMPDRELWFGVREVGPDYEHPDYTVTIFKASYSKSDDGTVAVRPPFSVVARVDPSVGFRRRIGSGYRAWRRTTMRWPCSAHARRRRDRSGTSPPSGSPASPERPVSISRSWQAPMGSR